MSDTRVIRECCSLVSDPVFSWNGQGHQPENEPARRLLEWLEREAIPFDTLLSSPGLPLHRVETGPGQGLLVLHENPAQQRFLEQQASFGRLAAGFVHNLNNPLNALGGLVQLLQMKLGENRDLEKMERQLDALAGLVRCAGERYRKLHSRTEGLALGWERIIRQELEFYYADGVLKHQVQTTIDVSPDEVSPLEFGDASWVFDRLLEALIGCIEGRGNHCLRISIEDHWPCLTLSGDQPWNREKALLRFADGRLQTLLGRCGRGLHCLVEGNGITLYTQESR